MQDQRDLDQNEGHQVPGTWYLFYPILSMEILGTQYFWDHSIYSYLYCMLYVVSILYASFFVICKVFN